MNAEPARVVVANYNLHAGIDGWGRPYDVVAASRAIDADVLVLEEVWSPTGAPGQAEVVAGALGYEVSSIVLASGRRALPHPDADERWMRSFDWRGSAHALYLDSERPLLRRVHRSARFTAAEPGGWGIAVLSRLPVLDHHRVDLGRLRRDRARRAALVVRLDAGGRPLTVVGTHMTHLTYGSPSQFRRLRRRLEPLVGDGPAVLAGDMNLWGPPVALLLRRWRRAVVGRTWPAWRPHSQVDHILVRGPVTVLGGEVLADAGSDHRPVRAELLVG
ncbi:MAG: endonuclease/exonuclease/phosphatase family protein [Acidimicrobiales bacterium]